jgi:phosphonate transport system substrate-binding protein
MGIVSQEGDPEAAQNALALAKKLSEETGLSVQSIVGTSYDVLVRALEQKKTHMAWLPALTYIYAKQQGAAEVGLVSNHFGVFSYGTQFVANADSQFTVYFDPAKNQATADAANALRQLAGKRPCWVEPTSPSGYVLPAGTLTAESIETLPPVIVQEHTAVIRTLYHRGVCDFGATFAGSGDPRTAASLQTDLPDVMTRVVVLWQSEPVIPNLNVSFIPDLPQPVRVNLMNALIEMAQSEEGKTLLEAANGYEIGGLKPVEDAYYDQLRSAVDAARIDLASTLGK